MAKNKLKRFAENLTFKNLFQPDYHELRNNDHPLKGKWGSDFFKNNHPIILELGCGKGEYTIGLAKKNPEKNFIGIDFKGARLWRGAKNAIENNYTNILFIRTRIEFIENLFAQNEISEIWITFPDPQPNKEKKRLTSPNFISKYKNFLTRNGIIHLKTDSIDLFNYTLRVIKKHNYPLLQKNIDIYNSSINNEVTEIKTFYEKMFISQGLKINYLHFRLLQQSQKKKKTSARNDDISFFEKVYEIVRQIPYGRVTSYGAIANYLGTKGSARMVGWAMNASHTQSEFVPAHRVVNRIGLLTGKHHFGGSNVMQQMLENEGIKVTDNKIENFEKYFWDPEKELE